MSMIRMGEGYLPLRSGDCFWGKSVGWVRNRNQCALRFDPSPPPLFDVRYCGRRPGREGFG
jgi:hypothetical protein